MIVEKHSRQEIQVISDNNTSGKIYQHQILPDDPLKRAHHYCGISGKMHNLYIIIRKHYTNPNLITFYKITDQYSSKVSSS